MLRATEETLARAWALPVARLYAPLLSQSFTSICGPTSVANVLRSMRVETGRNPFRRFGLRAMSLDQLVAESAEIVPKGWQVRAVLIDLSTSPYVDLAGARMLAHLADELARRSIVLHLSEARGDTRDLLRTEGIDKKVGGVDRFTSFADVVDECTA